MRRIVMSGLLLSALEPAIRTSLLSGYRCDDVIVLLVRHWWVCVSGRGCGCCGGRTGVCEPRGTSDGISKLCEVLLGFLGEVVDLRTDVCGQP